MGQKVNPVSFRLGGTQNWKSRWFTTKQFQEFLKEDFLIRDFLTKKLAKAGVDRVEIERSANSLEVVVQAARPGLIIGRGGSGIEDLRKEVNSLLSRKLKKPAKNNLRLSVEEVKNAEIRASVVAQNIVEQIEKRMPFRRVLRQSIERVAQSRDVQGVKIMMSGRLDGNEIARREWLRKGSIPLQTIRADIDYAQATAFTTYGTIGIKVWVYKKEDLNKKKEEKK
ncbi:MAG: 30S ribosomal protein S3 [Candidatus Portnoybacteria bacterium]|nr:30S ribosomal protein S3 [Candidatus Portnoybacteria bacterium]MDD4982579.1 30S ribosomal protein S3 [Candidatus Portnoybacteria bacterium]